MRMMLLAISLAIVGCANQPAPPDRDADGQRVAEALNRGYKVVNTNGEVLYCRSDFVTASRIQKNTVCLTAQQLDDLDQRNQQTLNTPNRPIVTPGRGP